MAKLTYTEAETIKLKNHPDFDEAWLQSRIAENPALLGLGEIDVLERERKQSFGGRLDLLLHDADNNIRYEVELQLGTTDESHIIRCLEYWDHERRRYPGYDHCAVLVAEEITSRLLNVLQLFNGHIPMIILRLTALKIDDKITLSFVRVMDRFTLRNDDVAENKQALTDRNYWNNLTSPKMIEVADKVLEMVNASGVGTYQLNYNKYYIGLSDGHRSRNFIHCRPKKKFIKFWIEIDAADEWMEKLEEAGVVASKQGKWLLVTLTPALIQSKSAEISEVITAAAKQYHEE